MKYIDYQWHKEVQKRREGQEKQNKSRNNAHTNKADSDYFIFTCEVERVNKDLVAVNVKAVELARQTETCDTLTSNQLSPKT